MSDSLIIDEMYQNIESLFDYNPPELSLSKSSNVQVTGRTSFYNKHLDDRFMLKRIVIVPSLVSEISRTVDITLGSLEEQHIKLPFTRETIMVSTSKSRESNRYEEPIVDVMSVIKAYQTTTARYCGPIASMLSLSPQAPKWATLLVWKKNLWQKLDDTDSSEEDFGTQLKNMSESAPIPISRDVLNSLDENTLDRLQSVREKFPILAVWDIMVPSAEAVDILKAMDALSPAFHYEKCSNIGYASPPLIELHMPDAVTTPWGDSVTSFAQTSMSGDPTPPPSHHHQNAALPPIKNARVAKTKTGPGPVKDESMDFPLWPNITIPDLTDWKDDKAFGAGSAIQRAWSRAVHRDGTFIVFHCGNFERIGFRHRATQTLFLSELIDVPHCKNPGYGKIHLGLYLCIIHDVLNRMEQITKSLDGKPSKRRKRQRSDTVVPGNAHKKPRTRAALLKEQAAETERHDTLELLTSTSSSRNMVLIQFRYGGYNSTAPAVFRRSGQSNPGKGTTYSSQEYLSVVITSDIAAGAVGNAHSATLAILAPDNTTHTLDVVVKLSFRPKQQDKMRHEHLIYERLASSGVSGIPVAIGLFEDLESGTLALIMTHVGISLTGLYPRMTETPVSDPARSEFIQVLKGIHDAGVQHCDIRSENLCLDQNNKPYIIDFDRAKLDPSEEAKGREIYRLTSLLEGDALENSPMPPTPDDGGFESATDEGFESNSDDG